MEKRSYNPYIMGKIVFDLNEKTIPAIEEEVGQHGIDISILGSQNESQERDITEIKDSLNSMGTRVTALETPKAISSTPFETGETYNGKPVKKVALALNNTNELNLSTANVDLGIGLGDIPAGVVFEGYIISNNNVIGGIRLNFKAAIQSGENITAAAYPEIRIAPNSVLVFEYIEKDEPEETAEVSES